MKNRDHWVFFLLGRRVYSLYRGEWALLHSDDSKTPIQMLESWLEDHAPSGAASCSIVWEPFGFVHERVETPKVDRKTFASMANVLRDHPMVSGGTYGWGLEPTGRGAGVSKTWLHIETVPELEPFGSLLEKHGFTVKAAWSLYTVSLSVAEKTSKSGLYSIFVAHDFIGVFTAPTGNSSGFRSILQTLDLQQPSASSQAYEVFTSAGFLDASRPSAWAVVGEDGNIAETEQKVFSDPPGLAASWVNATTRPQTKRVGWAEVGQAVMKMSASHPANLWDAFPRPYPLDQPLKVAAVFLVLLSAALGWQWYATAGTARAAKQRADAKLVGFDARATVLASNIAEIKRLDRESGDGSLTLPKGRAAALRILGEAIPESFTLTQFNVDRNGNVEGTVMQLADGADLVGLAAQMQRSGFEGCEVFASDDRSDATGPKKYRIKAKIKIQ